MELLGARRTAGTRTTSFLPRRRPEGLRGSVVCPRRQEERKPCGEFRRSQELPAEHCGQIAGWILDRQGERHEALPHVDPPGPRTFRKEDERRPGRRVSQLFQFAVARLDRGTYPAVAPRAPGCSQRSGWPKEAAAPPTPASRRSR